MVAYGKCGMTPGDYRLAVVEGADDGAVPRVRTEHCHDRLSLSVNDAFSVPQTFMAALVHVQTRVTHHAPWRTGASAVSMYITYMHFSNLML